MRKLTTFLTQQFEDVGFKIAQGIKLDSAPENAKYDALTFAIEAFTNEALTNKPKGTAALNIVYRNGNITPDRPGAFLSLWQRPTLLLENIKPSANKPIPLSNADLDYLIVRVNQPVNLQVNQNHHNKN